MQLHAFVHKRDEIETLSIAFEGLLHDYSQFTLVYPVHDFLARMSVKESESQKMNPQQNEERGVLQGWELTVERDLGNYDRHEFLNQ